MSVTDKRATKGGGTRKSAARQSSARIDALAVLPVFMKLRGRRVMVTGGDAPSAWKAELASAAGARVTVFANAMGDEMEALAARPARDGFGSVELVRRPWSLADVSNAALLIGDAATDGEAWALKCAGQAVGVPVNVIDKPQWCEFQFSTIVNRSPIVIAISTDGAAPIVGQAVRQRIEAVLGPALGAWAKLAQRIRPLVNERLAMGPERRAFWQSFAKRVFSAPPPVGVETDLADAIEAIRSEKPAAKILLIGAGPLSGLQTDGLTLGAIAALQSADRILHSAEMPAAVLELARREAERDALSSADPEYLVAAVAQWVEEDETVALLLPGDPAGQRPELVEALSDYADENGLTLEVPPAIAAGNGVG